MDHIIEAPTRPNGLNNSPLDGIPLSRTSINSDAPTEIQRLKPKIGVLGLGSIGSRHFRNFKDLGCEVHGFDPVDDTQWARGKLIEWADAIVVATPIPQHQDDIFDCYNAIKPCFVEKPIVHKELGEALYKAVLMVGYNLRFHSCVKKAREWLGAGMIGKPLWARFTCAQYNDKPAYLRDGVILNWSHEIDLALYLLGNASFRSCSVDKKLENVADINIISNNIGCHTSIHLDYLTKFERRGFLIVGTDGSIEADLVGRQAIIKDNKGLLTAPFHQGRGTFDGDYVAEARAFLDRLDGKDALGCTADEAMQVVKICLEAKECVR